MSNLKDNILNEIKEKKIMPKARWQFLLKDYSIWAMFGLAVVVGSLAFAVVLLMLRTHFQLSVGGWLYVPYFWILILVGFSVLAYFNLRHTKRGYKFNPYILVLISIFVSFIFGFIIFGFGWSTHIERQAYRYLPGYHKIMEPTMKKWSNPENGVLVGVVVKINEDQFEILSPRRDEWRVNYKNLDSNFLKERVRIIGKLIGPELFEADEVIPCFDKFPPKQKMDERNFPEKRIN